MATKVSEVVQAGFAFGSTAVDQTDRLREIEHEREDGIIEAARQVILKRFERGEMLVSPDATRRYLQTMLAASEHEIFACVFLDNRHQVVGYEEMFRGTVDGASVYPREVLKAALQHNAAAVIFTHNHPSGVAEPSSADRTITKRLVDALSIVDIRVLDHVIVAENCTSFAERGLL